MIRAIFFDLGKVLVDFDWKIATRQMVDHSDRSMDEIMYVCTGSDLVWDFERGLISTDKFLPALKQALRFKENTTLLGKFWSAIFTPIESHVKILENLQKHYYVGLISNTNALHYEFIKENYFFVNLFRRTSLSFEIGSVKPERTIFEHAGALLDVRPEEIVFIDDLEKNLTGAIEMGWKAIHLTKSHSLREELSQLGIP